jgi:hypothetical protein
MILKLKVIPISVDSSITLIRTTVTYTYTRIVNKYLSKLKLKKLLKWSIFLLSPFNNLNNNLQLYKQKKFYKVK